MGLDLVSKDAIIIIKVWFRRKKITYAWGRGKTVFKRPLNISYSEVYVRNKS